MEKWSNTVLNSPQCRYRNYPSFSSTLLDAIYRSMDDETQPTDPTKPFPPPTIPASTRSHRPKKTRSATSTSSSGSSYSGFSSSESESIPTRLRPIRTSHPLPTRSNPQQPTGPDQKQSIRTRLLLQLRKRRSAPDSPASRLTNFINSLFSPKSKSSRNAVSCIDESVCSSASSYSRSCLSKTPSSGKRSVRFCPISVVFGEDCRPCGHKCLFAGDRVPAAAAPVMEEEEESDSSSDLFELENLGQFRDELPVYETTRIGKCGGVSRGLVV